MNKYSYSVNSAQWIEIILHQYITRLCINTQRRSHTQFITLYNDTARLLPLKLQADPSRLTVIFLIYLVWTWLTLINIEKETFLKFAIEFFFLWLSIVVVSIFPCLPTMLLKMCFWELFFAVGKV